MVASRVAAEHGNGRGSNLVNLLYTRYQKTGDWNRHHAYHSWLGVDQGTSIIRI